METLRMLLGAILSVLPLLAALHTLAASRLWPKFLDRIYYGSRHTAWHYAYLVLACFGFGWAAFCGAKSALWWIPESIGSANEDGDWTSLRAYISGVIGLVAGVTMPSALAKLAGITTDQLLRKEAEDARKQRPPLP